MNSNFFLVLVVISFVGCGVKGDPSPPKDAVLPSLIENYSDIKTNKPVEDVKLKR